MTVRDILILIAALAVDLGGYRTSVAFRADPAFWVIGLFAIIPTSVSFYVSRKYRPLCFLAIYGVPVVLVLSVGWWAEKHM